MHRSLRVSKWQPGWSLFRGPIRHPVNVDAATRKIQLRQKARVIRLADYYGFSSDLTDALSIKGTIDRWKGFTKKK
jgi:hypothetical protein